MLKAVVVICFGAAAVSGLSYLQERSKYAFAAEVEAGLREAPWTRPVGTLATADLMSPVTWLWPTKTTWRIAQPMMGDGAQRRRFQESIITYGREPSTYILDVDCQAMTVEAADVNQPPAADAMLNVLGEPVRDAQGKPFRYITTKQPWPADDVHQFCETDWTQERRALPR